MIPAEIRDRLDIRQGTQIAIVEENGRLLFQPVTDAFIKNMRGSLLKYGMPAKLDRDPDRELYRTSRRFPGFNFGHYRSIVPGTVSPD